MPLQKQNIFLNFRGGLDSKTDPKQVIPAKVLNLQNGVFTSLARFKKRNGYTALSTVDQTGTAIPEALAAMSYKDELLVASKSTLYSYSSSSAQVITKGSINSVEVGVNAIVRDTYQQTTCDSAYNSMGIQVFTWEDSRAANNIRYTVVDVTTGQSIVSDAAISTTGKTPKPISIGQYVLIFYYNTSNNHLQYKAISALIPTTLGAAVDVATNIDTTDSYYDCMVMAQNIYVAYNNDSGGTGISVKYISSFLVQSSAVAIAAEEAATCINIAADSVKNPNEVWITYYDGVDLRYFIRSLDLATAVLVPTTIETIANVRNVTTNPVNGTATVLYHISAAATYNHFVKKVTLTRAGVVSGIAVMLRSVGLASKVFYYNSNVYVAVAFQSLLQPTYFIYDVTLGMLVAKIAPSLGGGLTAKNFLPEMNNTGTGQYLFAVLFKDLLVFNSTVGTGTGVAGNAFYSQTGVEAASLDFTSQNIFQRAQMAENLHVSGGFLQIYDGISAVEDNFHIYPEPITITTSAAGGSIADGDYTYYVTYEWMDNEGQIQRSAPSIGQKITAAGGNTSTNTIVVPTLRLTAKQSTRAAPSVVIYRTIVNGNASVAYQITSVTSPLLNSTTVDTVSFADTFADASIIGHTLLYAVPGGVVDNSGPPATSLVTSYKNRLMLIPSENKQAFWFSKEIVPGVPVEFSDLFVQQIDSRGGDITAIIQMDDKFVLFKSTHIFYVVGEGPDDTGANNDFSQAQLITADSGCQNPRSIIETSIGVFYQSIKGIYLLDRALQVHYIGDDVEAYNDQVIVSATLIPNTTQVRFALDNGTYLVYDYYAKQWDSFTSLSAVDSTVFQNQYTYVTSNASLMQETPAIYLDNGSYYKMKLITSWLQLAGIQGFQRIYQLQILGEYFSTHKLHVQVAYDFNPNPTQDVLIDTEDNIEDLVYGGDSVYGESTPYGGAYPLYQWQINLARQKCESIQFTIEDIQNGNYGQGYSISSLSLIVGVKEGLNKLASTRSYS